MRRLSLLLALAVSVLVTIGGIAARSPSLPEAKITPATAATTVPVPTPLSTEGGSTMKTEAEIQAMLDRFNGLEHHDIEGDQAEGIYETLLWLQGDRSDDDLAAFIPD